MIENTQTERARSRILRSARVLKAYFEHKLKQNLELLTEAPNEPLIDGVQFDLTVSGWGIWGLRASRPLDEGVQTEISTTFHGLLGAMDHLENKSFDLFRLQEKFEESLEEPPANVLAFRRPLAQTGRPWIAPTSLKRRWVLRLDCLIQSQSVSDIHKMALELHTQSQRCAFVEYHSLDAASRLDVEQLMQLGAINLFVPNVLDISLREQEILRVLLEQETSRRPLLMVGATLPLPDLRGEPAIHLEFLLLLSRAYIKLSRPFAEYRDKGLIHYFLDSLAQDTP